MAGGWPRTRGCFQCTVSNACPRPPRPPAFTDRDRTFADQSCELFLSGLFCSRLFSLVHGAARTVPRCHAHLELGLALLFRVRLVGDAQDPELASFDRLLCWAQRRSESATRRYAGSSVSVVQLLSVRRGESTEQMTRERAERESRERERGEGGDPHTETRAG